MNSVHEFDEVKRPRQRYPILALPNCPPNLYAWHSVPSTVGDRFYKFSALRTTARMSKPLRAQPLDSRGGSEQDCQSWPKSPASSPIPGCREVAKMPAGITVVAVHIKVRYREQVIRELQDLRLPNLEISECEKEYEF